MGTARHRQITLTARAARQLVLVTAAEERARIAVAASEATALLQSEANKALAAIPAWHTRVDAKLDEIMTSLKVVMNITINGTVPLPGEFPLQTSLRGIHEERAASKRRADLRYAYSRWAAKSRVVAACKSSFGKWVIRIAFILALNSLLRVAHAPISLQEADKAFRTDASKELTK